MNLFDGQFKSKPNINLAGSSKAKSRDYLINQAIEERKKRETERKQQLSAIKIQSLFRSYMIRKALKETYRNEFKTLFSKSDHHFTDAQIKTLLSYFVIFFDSNLDQEELNRLSQYILKNKENFVRILFTSSSSCNMNYSLCQFLAIHLAMLNQANKKMPLANPLISHSVSLRLIDYFTDPLSFAKLNYAVEQYENELGIVLRFLINRGFIKHLVEYACAKVPSNCRSEMQAPLVYSIGHLLNRAFLFFNWKLESRSQSELNGKCASFLIVNKLCSEFLLKCSTFPQVKLIVYKLAHIVLESIEKEADGKLIYFDSLNLNTVTSRHSFVAT
jgi:hypothetical protein